MLSKINVKVIYETMGFFFVFFSANWIQEKFGIKKPASIITVGKIDDTSDNHAVGMTPHQSLPMIRFHQSKTTLKLIAIEDWCDLRIRAISPALLIAIREVIR